MTSLFHNVCSNKCKMISITDYLIASLSICLGVLQLFGKGLFIAASYGVMCAACQRQNAQQLSTILTSSVNHSTGCPTILYPLLFFNFFGFLGVQKFHPGHFSTTHFMQILKISIFLSLGEIQTEILAKYYREVILKVNIFVY